MAVFFLLSSASGANAVAVNGPAVVGSLALVMSCNTAHYFYDRLQPFVNVPMLHMPRIIRV